VSFGAWQLAGGAIVGIVVGVASRWALRQVRLSGAASYGVLALAVGGVSYGAAAVGGASGFLAVYLTGMLLARKRRLAHGLRTFHEGLAGTAQAVLFLILGMLVFPSELPDVAGEAAVATFVLVLVARPIAVAASVVWFGFVWREIVLLAWAGLRGAVPIVLATIPLTAAHPDGSLVFDVAFVTVVISVAVQAPTVAWVARLLGLQADDPPAAPVEVLPIDSLDADVVELRLVAKARVVGARLAEVRPPGGARIAMVVRHEISFVPDGNTVLAEGDALLVVVPPGSDIGALAGWAGS
jgi:potassium/hydrogen antiporter